MLAAHNNAKRRFVMVQTPEKWYTVDEFLEAHLDLFGRNTLYEALRTKQIPSVRVGRRILIPYDALSRMLPVTTGSTEGK